MTASSFLHIFSKLKLKTLCFNLLQTLQNLLTQRSQQGHDIQCQNRSFQVPFSTVLRAESTVISGQFIFECSYPEGTY